MKTNSEETNQKIIKKINKYLQKIGHEIIASIFLEEYNGKNIYVCFNFVKKLSVFKVTAFDLNFIDLKHMEDYISIQTVNRIIASSIVSCLKKISSPSKTYYNPDIIGDCVHITLKKEKENLSYSFSRFLPEELKSLAEPITLIFSNLPRSTDPYLNEIFAILDHTEDYYTYINPIKLNAEKTNIKKMVSKEVYEISNLLCENNRILSLEKINNRYISLVNDNANEIFLVSINQIDEEFAQVSCNCENIGMCHHICATILSIQQNKFKNFLKIKYIGRDSSLLEQISLNRIYLYCGRSANKALLSDLNGKPILRNLVENGKLLYEVYEDDEQGTLTKEFEKMQKRSIKK